MKSRLSKVYQVAGDFGGPVAVIAVVLGLFGLLIWFFYIVVTGAGSWINAINDPFERGMAYVAIAIVLHAYVGKSNVDVRVDGKKES